MKGGECGGMNDKQGPFYFSLFFKRKTDKFAGEDSKFFFYHLEMSIGCTAERGLYWSRVNIVLATIYGARPGLMLFS